MDAISHWIKPRRLGAECPVEITAGNTIPIGGHTYKSKMLKHLYHIQRSLIA